ncbi:MAG: hypothetical protein ACJAT2_002950 [Bacteriovoracaceae bacterium]|jgi:hypothetical protein
MEAKKSSIVTDEVYMLKEGQFYMPTWGVLVTLVIALVVLKSFIYIKDEKRHGK